MRILLISYYFPPCGGAAVQRWLRWLPELVKAGFELTVLTTQDGDYPEIDETLLNEVPQSVKVIRVRPPHFGKLWQLLFRNKSQLPYGSLEYRDADGLIKRILIWIRLNLVIPDLRVFWNRQALKRAIVQIRNQPTGLVISTGPPHSTHLIALKLKQRFKITWVADWRDPWSEIHYLRLNSPSRLSLKLHKHLEARVIQSANLNILVSESLARQLPAGRKITIYNGFDADKMADLKKKAIDRKAAEMDSFELKYVGQLTAGQNIESALSLITASKLKPSLMLSFIGTKLSLAQKGLLDQYLPGQVRITDFLPHEEALKEMISADLLLLLINNYQGFEGILTTKLFEYMASGTLILAIGPLGGEAEKLIRQYGAGGYFSADQTEQALDYLNQLHQHWAQVHALKNDSDISALSSQNQALKLIAALRDEKKH